MATLKGKSGLQISLVNSCCAVVMAVLGVVATAPLAQAGDSGDVSIQLINVTQVEVEGNGSTYTGMTGNQSLTIQAHLQLDAGISGRVKWWRVTPKAKVPHDNQWAFNSAQASKEYGAFNRPKSVDKMISMQVASNLLYNFVVDACNEKADDLRNSGKTNEWIFQHDQSFDADVFLSLAYSMTGIEGAKTPQEVQAPHRFKVVCKALPARVPPEPTRNVPDVKSANLTIMKSSTLGGDCRLKLSGVIQTSEPDKTVQFRYVDDKGVKSNLKTVKSDHSSTAMFSHQYALPGTGLKTGKIQIVGKGNAFKSAWKDYSVTCNANAPGGVVGNVPPVVEMAVVPATYKNVNGHSCVDKMWLDGTITGKANQSGRARFTGNAYLSAYQDYSVTNGMKAKILVSYTFNWGIVPVNGYVTKDLYFTFKAENENDVVVAATPLKKFTFTCGSKQAEIVPGAIPKTPVKVKPVGINNPQSLKRK